ncbi:hypothetical protein VFMJ11_A0338 [Aliivibrio fischeri MJ11]|uniref:Uncharacterized protein n=1 Tax=Aliivibrio fischeri (strain MJ11) TaxID=388396 RepID=B5ET75_ALIFM|nr:hypothetical protein VFMJ11_A0338 [Aliivibrio fischeri MJ11]
MNNINNDYITTVSKESLLALGLTDEEIEYILIIFELEL